MIKFDTTYSFDGFETIKIFEDSTYDNKKEMKKHKFKIRKNIFVFDNIEIIAGEPKTLKKEKVKEIIKVINELNKVEQKAEINFGEEYYTILLLSGSFSIISRTSELSERDYEIYRNNLYFQTMDEAEKAIEKLKSALKKNKKIGAII